MAVTPINTVKAMPSVQVAHERITDAKRFKRIFSDRLSSSVTTATPSAIGSENVRTSVVMVPLAAAMAG